MTIRYRIPDKKNAASILEAASRDMKFTLSMQPTEESGPTIVRNIYECFRMLGEALLVSEGKESDDHVTAIKELMRIRAKTQRPIELIDNLRRLRHNVNYYGYRPSVPEVEDALAIAKVVFFPMHEAVSKKLR